jgi:hypothetical protein
MAFIGDCTPAFPRKERAMPRRFKQTKSFQDRLSEFIEDARSAANAAPDGADELVKKIQKAQTAADIEAWAKAPGSQPHK